ncbi:hypothetical protein CDAR_523061 [Caerostris darwini]|uniref:Uncharacterized protein n=1 Tax=Caerostris darwini TaxID=1538125 RepID=A0AAV4TDL2_9ARAC|nr:hypothetical protein CDAR_523061 [Caerostris darwini]
MRFKILEVRIYTVQFPTGAQLRNFVDVPLQLSNANNTYSFNTISTHLSPETSATFVEFPNAPTPFKCFLKLKELVPRQNILTTLPSIPPPSPGTEKEMMFKEIIKR